jgi:hypothetical protein
VTIIITAIGEQREQVAEPRHDSRREQLVQRFDVRRHARHEPADRRAVVESDRQSLHVIEQLLPQVPHDALAKQRREHRFPVRAAERGDERRGEHQRRAPRQRRVAGRHCHVDHLLREHRPDELQQPIGHQQRQRTGDERAVRPHVHEQSPHQPAVVALACLEVLVAGVRGERGGHGERKVIASAQRYASACHDAHDHTRPYVVRRLR